MIPNIATLSEQTNIQTLANNRKPFYCQGLIQLFNVYDMYIRGKTEHSQ